MGYTPLDSQIIHSSVWRESDHVRLLWITMLAMSDRNGYVKCSIIGLSDAAKVSLEKTEEALKRLQSPDRYSSTKEFQGKRIEEVDGGWMILNYLLYRTRAREVSARDKAAARQRRWYHNHKNRGNSEENVINDDVLTISALDRRENQLQLTPPNTKFLNSNSNSNSKLNNNNVAEALQIVGVVGLGLKAILGKVNTVAEVFLLAEQAKFAKARNVPAWIVARLKNGYEPPGLVQAQTICGWQERIVSVCGHALNNGVRLKYDAAGNLIVRETDELEVIINPNDLSPNSIEFR